MTQTNAPSGISTSTFLQVVVRGADDLQPVLSPSGRRVRRESRSSACRTDIARSGCAARRRSSSAVPMATTSPPRTPGPGPKSTIVIGGPHRVFVVLDDDDGVAQVAQLRERVEQPVVVARVQADRRLVENVEHADQAAADLAGQANALRFAAGERRGRAVERQIIEPDVEQESPSRPRISLSTSAAISCRVASSSSSLKNSAASATASAQTSGSERAGRSAKLRMPRGERHRAGLRVRAAAPCTVAAADRRACIFRAAGAACRSCELRYLRQQLGDDALELAAVFVTPRAVLAR